MRYVERSLKGTFGYIKKQRTFEIVKTIVLYMMAFGIFFIGYFTLGTKKSLWSVFGVLALLPACKSLVGVIMLARFSSLEEDRYIRYKEAAGNVLTLYENILTTNERTFFIPVIGIAGGTVTAFVSTDEKSAKDATEHIMSILEKAGYKVTVKLFTDEAAFIERLKELNDKYGHENDPRPAQIANTIKAVSV